MIVVEVEELEKLGRHHVPSLMSRPGYRSVMNPLSNVAPEFVEMAHRIVWCVVGTSDAGGFPRTRVLAPDLGVGRRLAHRLDRHLAQLTQSRGPARHTGGVDHLLVAEP